MRARPSRHRLALPALDPLESRTLLSAVITSALSFGNNSTAGDSITSMVTDAAGVTYLTGSFSNSMDIDPSNATFTLTSHGGRDLFLAAFQQNQLLWAFALGGTGDDNAGSLLLFNGTLLLSGSFSGSLDADPGASATTLASNGGTDALLARFSTRGDLLWAKSFGGTGDDSASRLSNDVPRVLLPSEHPAFFLLGSFSGTADLDPGAGTTNRTATSRAADLFLSRIDDNGDLVWANNYTYDDDLVIANLHISAGDTLAFAGHFRGNVDLGGGTNPHLLQSTPYSGYVAQLNATSGQLLWVKTFGDPSGPYSALIVDDFTADPTGNLFVGGDFGGTVDLDPSPASHTLSESISPDGFTGYVLKLDKNGNYLWAGALTGDSWSDVYALTTDSGGNVYLAGDFNQTTDFDLSSATHNVTAPNTLNTAYVAKYDSAGHFLWELHATAGTGLSRSFVLSAGPQNRIAVAGEFANSLTFQTTAQGASQVVTDTVLTGDSTGDNFLFFVGQSPATPSMTVQIESQYIAGQHVPITVLLSAPHGTPTGTVTLYDGGASLGDATLDADGFAAFTFMTTEGTHRLFVAYHGDANFVATNSATVPATVVPNTFPMGSIDRASFGTISGWAADPDAPAARLVIQLFVDGTRRVAFHASEDRPDLQPLFGRSNHGFTCQLPPLSAGSHAVSIVAFDVDTSEGRTLASTTVASDSLYFDEPWYLNTYPDVAAAWSAGTIASGWQHFQQAGAHEGRSPSPFFDETWYRAHNPDVADAIAAGRLPSGFVHFVLSGNAEGRDPSPFFSTSFYLRAYADVRAARLANTVASAFDHFLITGLAEGRVPTAWFNPAEYRAAFGDVALQLDSGTLRSPYDHFLRTGLTEKRAPSALFNESFYLAQNPDVAAAVADRTLPSGLAHFIATGITEGRPAMPTFDAAWYLSQYPDAPSALTAGLVKTPFQHYLFYGRLAGHLPHP